MAQNCIFCKIVAGEIPCHKIWEDEKHLAFLSIFPNTEGFSVVIPKKHYSSYAFDLPDQVLQDLIIAAKKVGKLLDEKLADVGRTGLIFEGFGVDHVHAKLFPMHGTVGIKEWNREHQPEAGHPLGEKPVETKVDKYFDTYPGYISSHDYKKADDAKLAELAKKIRGE
jgi:histidine triad (HIT) family protein